MLTKPVLFFTLYFLLFHSPSWSINSASHHSTANVSYNTACSQYAHLNTLPTPVLLSSFKYHPLNISTSSIFILLLLLSGDIEVNPGSTLSNVIEHSHKFSLCTLNVRSISNEDHIIHLHDIADIHNYGCFALSETWLSSQTSPSHYLDIPPYGYDMVNSNRDSVFPNANGGGIAFLLRRP